MLVCWCVGHVLVCSSFLSSSLLQVLVAYAPMLLGQLANLTGAFLLYDQARLMVIHLLFLSVWFFIVCACVCVLAV